MNPERTTEIQTADAGATSRTFTAPESAIGGYFRAANDFGVSIDDGTELNDITGGEFTPYLALKAGQEVKLTNATDTGACDAIFVIGD